jgi:DNA-binding MurR/RpiR family transcriptional regulator
MSRSGTDISASDTIDDIVAKVAFTDASAVEETAQQLDREALAAAAAFIAKVATVESSAVEEAAQQLNRDALLAAVAAIAGAGRVDIYGIGASAIVGTDLQQKLHRIGVISFAWNDPHIALTSATLLARQDVAIGISHSGATSETVESLAAARARRATTIAITNFPLSPLAAAADIVLTTAARETTLRSGATASRIAALTVIDCLYIAVAQRDLPRARKHVADSRKAVAGHHVV